MKVVAVINYKGGVGKTTLTANLGAYAASQGKRVLLIDLDPQTQLTFNFIDPIEWQNRYESAKTLRNYLEPITKGTGDIISLSEFTISARAGDTTLDIISSHLDLIEAEIELAAMVNGVTVPMVAANSLKTYSYLRNGLQELNDKYDLCLIDCPPNFYVLVKNALLASNYYIIPSRLDYLSTSLGVSNLQRGITNFMKQYDDYRDILKDKKYTPVFLSVLGVVPMMVTYSKDDKLINAQAIYKDELQKKGYPIFTHVRNNSSVFGVAPQIGLPVVLTNPKFFQKTQRRIVDELKQLGEEFLSAVKL